MFRPDRQAPQVQHHPPPASIKFRPVQEVCTIIAPTRVEESEESFEKTKSRLLIVHKHDQGNKQRGRPPPITTKVLSSPIPLLRQRPRVHFAKRSDAISMQLIPCPTKEVFVDPFPLDLARVSIFRGICSFRRAFRQGYSYSSANKCFS